MDVEKALAPSGLEALSRFWGIHLHLYPPSFIYTTYEKNSI